MTSCVSVCVDGPAVSVTVGDTAVAVTVGGAAVAVELVTASVAVTTGDVSVAVVESPIYVAVGLGGQPGAQGLPGPAQIYDQLSAPTPIAGYILLWFQSGVTADPDDREMNLVVSP